MVQEKIPLIIDDETEVSAVVPVIISASRSTDIPAYYAGWFMNRLEKGYIRWINSFNPNLPYYVSFQKTRAIVFWSKNPSPMIPFLQTLDEKGFSYYFQYTLNNYGPENLEPGVPSLDDRIATFIQLSEQIGRERVLWRFDPVLLTPSLDVKTLLDRISYIGDRISPYTEKMIFSFIEMKYKKVQREASLLHFRSLSSEEKHEFVSGIVRLNREWNLTLASCADETDYFPDIGHNKCIDDVLFSRIAPTDRELIEYLKKAEKDPGQRPACKCIRSKDIGQYDTCLHGCFYCYATDHEKANNNFQRHLLMPGCDTITGEKPVFRNRLNTDIRKFLE